MIFFNVMLNPSEWLLNAAKKKVLSVDGQVSELRILTLQIPLLYLCKEGIIVPFAWHFVLKFGAGEHDATIHKGESPSWILALCYLAIRG